MENYGVVVGDLALPPTARLRLQKIENKQFDVYEYIDLARSIKENGLLFMVTLAANSTDFNYLEGKFSMKLVFFSVELCFNYSCPLMRKSAKTGAKTRENKTHGFFPFFKNV